MAHNETTSPSNKSTPGKAQRRYRPVLGLVTAGAVLTIPLCARIPLLRRSGDRSADLASARDLSPEEDQDLQELPQVGDHRLRILSPTVLELFLVNTKRPDERVAEWDFVDDRGATNLPDPGSFRIEVNGKSAHAEAVGFRRRVLYAPLRRRDLRIGNSLYLRLSSPIPPNAEVEVRNPGGNLWPVALRFHTRAAVSRLSPAIHVNQVGYLPGGPKSARIGCYLGSLGELDLHTVSRFHLVRAGSGEAVFTGEVKPMQEQGWTYPTPPYQQVLEADFTAYRTPGAYRIEVPGLGVSLPFRIDEGTAAAFARTYALGLYHQRCGAENALPFTRFVHAPCHTAPAEVPTMENASVQKRLAGDSANYKNNPRHTAPQLKDLDSALYPFVHQGRIDVSGGHHDAGDYSKYTINSAQLIHTLLFAADAFPGAADLDNLGLPESGDGKSDLLQLARWEADFLAKMQDDDGGFYFLVYPRDRAYEQNVLPDHGDPQVVFPKTTAVTAAATAALAQAASSPRFRREFPQAAALYLAKALKGWAFLERAWGRYGMDGSYQKITHYGDTFMHDDEIAWAATELYLATGDHKYHDTLRTLFDPADKKTIHWSWDRLFESYGCAIRSYAFAARTGRLSPQQLDPVFLEKCRTQILAAAQDRVDWANASAYGTSFPVASKRFRTAGWYFAAAQAFDIAVADQLAPSQEHLKAILSNLNYEAGCNPNNVVFVTGLGHKRQYEIVSQFALNDGRSLPPSGISIGSVQDRFMYLDKYKRELGALSFPLDGVPDRAYPFYDRWGDSFNVITEATIPIQGRCLAAMSWLMARSSLKGQPWRAARAVISGIPKRVTSQTSFSTTLHVEGLDTRGAQILWESDGQEPTAGNSYHSAPRQAGRHWIEAEAQWPDGRRAFAVTTFRTSD